MSKASHNPNAVDGLRDVSAAALAQLALVQRMMPIGTLDIDVSNGLTGHRSPDYLHLHGLPDDLQSETHDDWLVRVHPQDRDRADHVLRSALEGTSDFYENEYRIVRPNDGETRWIRARAEIARDERGTPTRIIGVHIDVTRERQTEAALRESRERLVLSLRAARLGWYEWSSEQGALNLSPVSVDVFGLLPEQRIEDSEQFFALIHPDDRARHAADFDRAARSGSDFHSDYRIVRPRDGALAWIEEHGHGSVDSAKGSTRLRGVHWDITERKRAAEEVRESREHLRALIDGIPQLMWRSHAGGKWTWASTQWMSFTGQLQSESVGSGWLDAVHSDDRARAQRAWHVVGEGELQLDLRIRATSDRYRWFQVRGVPTRNAHGEIGEWFGTCTDIEDQVQARRVLAEAGHELEERVTERTHELRHAIDSLTQEVQERELVEDRLRQSEKLKAIGQLTGGIAHDFNNMLQTISGSLGVIGLLVQQNRVQEVQTYLEKARRGVTRAAALTHRLLAFGRKQTLLSQPTSLDDIILGMEDMMRRTVGPEVTVELKLCDGRWLVLCDANQMESALLNLCVNAPDALPNGGWLTVGTQDVILAESDVADEEGIAPGKFCCVSVADTGAGMTADVLARAFEPFFTTKPEGHGTGLGLSQIYGFVRQSNGFIRIESSPGAGTTVRIYMPYFSTVDEDSPHGDEEPTVLLVEDEPDVREVTVEQFRSANFRVIEASTAEAALRLLQSGAQFDVLVSDVRLPGSVDGVQLADAVRTARPSVPIILISGYTDGRTLPGIPLIDKPFEFPILLDRVRTLLASASP